MTEKQAAFRTTLHALSQDADIQGFLCQRPISGVHGQVVSGRFHMYEYRVYQDSTEEATARSELHVARVTQ